METPQQIAHYLGITPTWVDGTSVGGCSFMLHVRHAAVREDVLVVHAAVEAEVLPEVALEPRHVHARATPLHGVQDIDPHVYQHGQEHAATAVIVMEHLDPEFVTQVDEALVVRRVELPVGVHADHRAW